MTLTAIDLSELEQEVAEALSNAGRPCQFWEELETGNEHCDKEATWGVSSKCTDGCPGENEEYLCDEHKALLNSWPGMLLCNACNTIVQKLEWRKL